MDIDRNTIEGFTERVRKNVSFMIEAHANGADIHVVTELTTALLGLIVFPYEHFKGGFNNHPLDELTAEGWPAWQFDVGTSDDLKSLIRHLRNALSHRRVRFSSDDRILEEVEITFCDRPNGASEDNWSATMNAADLLDFVCRFSEFIDTNRRWP